MATMAECGRTWTPWRVVATDHSCLCVMMMMMMTMTSYHAAKCCHLAVNGHTASDQRLCNSARQFLVYITFVLVLHSLISLKLVFFKNSDAKRF